jgi:hypothetical protein
VNEYRGSTYTIPWSGGVPYIGEGSIGASDDFSNSRPQLTDAQGAPLPGWAGLEERWKLWDPAQSVSFAGVDTRTQRAVMRATGKWFSGMYQPIPLPQQPGQAVSVVVYGQIALGSVQGVPDATVQLGPCIGGILLADDLDNAPTTSGGHIVGTYFAKAADSNPQIPSEIAAVAGDFIAYDSGASGLRAVCQSSGSPAYLRYRLRQTQVDATPTYLVELIAEWSTDGAGWVPLLNYPQETRPTPYKSAGFGLYPSGGVLVSINVDQWSMVLQDFKDPGSLIGGVQVLGAV